MKSDAIHVEITYAVPVEKVWKAITERAEIVAWYKEISDFKPLVGEEFDFFTVGASGSSAQHCKIVDIEENRLLRYTWSYPDRQIGESVVTWELIPRGNVTSVKLTHSGLSNHQRGGQGFSMQLFESGWHDILGKSLANYLERVGK